MTSPVTRRPRVVTATAVVGTALLRLSLTARPGSARFYLLTAAVAVTWAAGALAADPDALRPGDPDDRPVARRLVLPVLLGVAAFAVFYGCALVVRRIPVLGPAVGRVLGYAHGGSPALVLGTTLVNGAAEEVFFRGALYDVLGERHPMAVSTALYALATSGAGNPALVLAAVVMGTLWAGQREVTGGILAPTVTHLTWSVLMLRYLPPLFRPPAPA